MTWSMHAGEDAGQNGHASSQPAAGGAKPAAGAAPAPTAQML